MTTAFSILAAFSKGYGRPFYVIAACIFLAALLISRRRAKSALARNSS